MTWLVVLLALLGLSPSRTGERLPESRRHSVSEVRRLASRAGVDPDTWGTFLAAVAYRESRFSDGATNTTSGEAAAAARAYDRNAERYRDCGHARSEYVFGSGGLYGFIPANALAAFWGTPGQCLSPRKVFDSWASTVMALDYARRLMRYDAFAKSPTWRTLNRGWASLAVMRGEMPDRAVQTDARFYKALEAIGATSGFASRRVPALPSGWSAWNVYTRGEVSS